MRWLQVFLVLLLLPGCHAARDMAAGDQEDDDLPVPELHPGGEPQRQRGRDLSLSFCLCLSVCLSLSLSV